MSAGTTIQAGGVTLGINPLHGGVYLHVFAGAVQITLTLPASAAQQLAAALAPETPQQRDEVTA